MNNRSLRVLEFNKIVDLLKMEISSGIGKKIADALVPSSDYDEVKELLKETSEGASIILKYGNIPFGAIHPIGDQIRLAEIGGALNTRQLLEVSDNLRSTRNIKNFITRDAENKNTFPILYGLATTLTPSKGVEDRINSAIIGEGQISDNASIDLRKIRREIDNKHNAIKNKLESIIKSADYQKYLQDSLVTIRQDRFVVPVKSEYKNQVKGLVHDQSSSGATLYIEPFAVVELNNDLKELALKEQQEIDRILLELSGLVGEIASALGVNQTIMAKIDFISGKGRLSLKMKGNEPELNQKGYVRMVRARHPLINPNEVVANTIWIGKEFKTLLITGPNTGGKTVTLKTMGLLCLMNQAGLHVPADHGTEMTLFTGIFADIGDEQSIEQSLSTFSSHMTNIVKIMAVADKNALVLLDELGAGTDPTEGAALAMAILNRLFKLGVTTMATTHYSELKEFAITTPGVENACVEFNVDTLSPTYKLLIGIPGKSNAFEISRKLGLAHDIIESAKGFVQTQNIQFEDVLANIEDSRRKAIEEMDEATKLRIEVDKLKSKLKDKEEKLIQQREKILKDSREEARQLIKSARDEADQIISDLKKAGEMNAKDRNKLLEESKKSLKNKLEAIQDPLFDTTVSFHEIPKNLKIGDEVRLVHLNQNATVSTLPDANGNVIVQAGIMKFNTSINNLMLIKKKEEFTNEFKVTKTFESKSSYTESEIDLRGMNVDEAVIQLDKYIDDAYLANIHTVRIIHGKGTGALRNGLNDYFKSHRYVKSYRIGAFNEGGNGVTVLELE